METNEPHKFVFNLSQRLDLKVQINILLFKTKTYYYYYTRKNIRKQYKKNKLKIIAPTWNDEFKLPHGSYSVSDAQDYIEYSIKKHETLTITPLIRVYINRINNRLVFTIKD